MAFGWICTHVTLPSVVVHACVLQVGALPRKLR